MHALGPARIGQARDVLDVVLLPAMLGRARRGEGAALHHHVVLHVLDDQRAAPRLKRQPAAGLILASAQARRSSHGPIGPVAGSGAAVSALGRAGPT